MRRLKAIFVLMGALTLSQCLHAATVIGSHRNAGESFWGQEQYSAVSKSGLFAAGVRELNSEAPKALLVRFGPGPSQVFNVTWPVDGTGRLTDVEEISIDGRTDAIVCGTVGLGGYISRRNGDTGEVVWEFRYESEFGSELSALIVRPTGIYATGYIGGDQDVDFLTMKFDPVTGHKVWERRWESDTGGATGITSDLGHNIFVVGMGTVAGKSAKQFIVVKYSLAGTYLGTGNFGTDFAGHDPYGGSIDCDGVNVVVSGTVYNGATRGIDTATVCFNNSVVQKWNRLEDMDSDEDFARRAAFDQAGNVYTLAEAHGAEDRWLTRIYSYTANGTSRFVYNDGPVGYYTSAFDLVVLPSGRCYYTGFSIGVQADNFYIGAMQNGVNLWRAKRGEGEGHGIASNNGVITAVGFAPLSSGSFDVDPYCVTVREDLVAVDDYYLVREGEQLSVSAANGVLRNDQFNQGPGTVTLFQQGTHGTATVDPDGAFWYSPDPGYLGTDTFQYRWFYGTGFAVGTVTLNVVVSVKAITIPPTTITGIATVPAFVELTSAAGPGGAVVNLTSDSTLLALSKPNVTVPAGELTASFYLKPKMVTATQNVVISAYLNGHVRSKTVTLRQLRPSALTVNPNPVWGGASAVGRIALDGLAGQGGQEVTITDNSSFVMVPATVTVPMSASAVTFNVTSTNPSSTQSVTLTGRIGAYTVTRVFVLNRVYAQSLTLQPSTVTGGSSSTATVTLNGPAPPGGATVSIFDSSAFVTPPTSVVIPAGATSAQFTVQTVPVSFTVNCSIRATYNGVTGSASLILTP